jgi:serine/threonine-protein kinase
VVPGVAGQAPDAAQTALAAVGFAVDVKHQYDDTAAAGAVIGTAPAGGTRAPRDSTIVLLVSDGPAPVPVPDVTGQTFDAASQALGNAGFTVTRVDDFSATVDLGKVISTDPAANQPATRGGSVTVHVSKGPEMVKVPNLVGQTLEAAQQTLQSQGFDIDTQGYLPGRLVRQQNPAAGSTVNKGAKITLLF